MAITIRKLEGRDLGNGFLEVLNLVHAFTPNTILARIVMEGINKDPNQVVFVAVEETGRVIGTVRLLIEQKFWGKRVAHIEDVAVATQAQRQGVGKKLTEHALQEARFRDCYKAILDCSEENAPFYEACGFRKHETQMRQDL